MLRLGIEVISLTPVQVPERATLVRVQWRSGAVSELTVPRPSRHFRSRTPAAAVRRLRELASAGIHDEQIAQQLNVEGFRTGQQKPWTIYAVRWARSKEKIDKVAPDLARRYPLPDRFEDGRYSVAGAAKLFGISKSLIERWIKQGLILGSQQDYVPYKNVRFLVIDKVTEKSLKSLAKRVRRNKKSRIG